MSDEDWDDYDDPEPVFDEEPGCWDCWDSGIRRPAVVLIGAPPHRRDRPGRRRCPPCWPTARQYRRRELQDRHTFRHYEAVARRAPRNAGTNPFNDEAPF